MPTTPNLGITHVQATDTDKVTKINTALQAFDTALCAAVTIALSGSTYTMSAATLQSGICFIFTGALTGDCTVTLPSGISRFFLAVNQTTGGHNIIFTA